MQIKKWFCNNVIEIDFKLGIVYLYDVQKKDAKFINIQA